MPTRKPHGPTDIASLARVHSKTAIKVLVGIMNQRDSSPTARIQAAQVLLDRGYGKAAQAIEHSGTVEHVSDVDALLEVQRRIEGMSGRIPDETDTETTAKPTLQ